MASVIEAGAFALLGPPEPWMLSTNGVFFRGEIGGPMDLTSEYRWNVPVLTYGFDQSFIGFFGTNGVAAVESAIKILNDLPPVSSIVLTNYPFDIVQFNSTAPVQMRYDLKSDALFLLLEHMGLAQPTRSIYVLKQWTPDFIRQYSTSSWFYWAIPDYIVLRNFDPQTLDPSLEVNGATYVAQIVSGLDGNQNALITIPLDPYADVTRSAADYFVAGEYHVGLSYDDVGGLCYLLSTNNVNYETLLPGVSGTGTNPNAFVNGAWRPGVDKIIFVAHAAGQLPGTFLSMTNRFTDTYLTNGVFVKQQLARVLTRPDFVFSANTDFFNTGATNWINNAVMNNNPSAAGPGVIQPPIIITFQKVGGFYFDGYLFSGPVGWSEDSVQEGWGRFGSFDGSTNAPILYPAPQNGNKSMVVRVQLLHDNYSSVVFQQFEWSRTSLAGTIYALQTSTNLSNWKTLVVTTNNGGVFIYLNNSAKSSARYYRLIPE